MLFIYLKKKLNGKNMKKNGIYKDKLRSIANKSKTCQKNYAIYKVT